jgi:hypothetical protein
MTDFPAPNGWASDPDDDEEDPEPKLSRLCIQIPDLRSRAKLLIATAFTPAGKEEAEELIEVASTMDYQLSDWAANLPPLFNYKSIAVPRPMPDDLTTAEMWPGPIHIYEDLVTAGLLNHYRLSRISCLDVILECAQWLLKHEEEGTYDRQMDYARVIFQQMVDEICASVPFHLGYHLQHHAREQGQDATGPYFSWMYFDRVESTTGREHC